MLILSRKVDQSILLGDVLVTVIEVRRGLVKLGFDAPDHVQITRTDAADQRPRDHRAIRESMAAGTPLHNIKQSLDHAENTPTRPSEEDMISPSRRTKLLEENRELRREIASMKRMLRGHGK